MTNAELSKIYAEACDGYVRKLCEMYDWDFDDCFWVSGEIGGTFCSCDIEYSLGMSDIKTLVDNEVDYETFLNWWNYNMLMHYAKENHPNDNTYYLVNLTSWLKKCPLPHTIESLEGEDKIYFDRILEKKKDD